MMEQEFNITDFPSEIIEKFLPDFKPKTVSAMKLVCWRFNEVFARDVYYKAYLIYPEECFMSDLKFNSPAVGVSEIVEEIKNGDCGKYEGFLRLQKVHLENLKSGSFERYEDFQIGCPKRATLIRYFEGLDDEDGCWLVCLFKEADDEMIVTLVNSTTKQELHFHGNFEEAYFQRGLLFLQCNYTLHGYKLTQKDGQYALNPAITFDAKMKLLDAGLTNKWVKSVNFFIGVDRLVMIIKRHCRRRSFKETTLLAVDIKTGKITHVDHVNLLSDFLQVEVVIPSPNIVHVLYRCVGFEALTSLRLHPSTPFGRVERLATRLLWRDSPTVTRSNVGANVIYLNADCLVWQRNKIVKVLDVRGSELIEVQTFHVSGYTVLKGFLWPDIVFTVDMPERGAKTFKSGVQVRSCQGGINWPLCTWDIDFQHRRLFLGSLAQWRYPSTKVVACGKSDSDKLYHFRIHYF